MGCSATHLDWTLVPYIRKSFYKHYCDGMKYIEEVGIPDFDNPICDTMSIESKEYKIFDKAYKYAMDKTEKELSQAVEGMYHNLNTLQSRSGRAIA